MTDSDHEQHPPLIQSEALAPSASSSAATLRYPQLLLETSFDSLLSHSYPSNPETSANMEAPQRDPSSLSESWASISDAELSLDDDLQSEHTDLGSLIDIHSAGDVQSVRDDETSSEAEYGDEDVQPGQQQEESIVLDTVQTPMSTSEMEPNVFDDSRITLDEPNPDERATATATKTMRHFSQDELRKWTMPVGEDLVGVMHMPLNKESIKDAGRQTLRICLFIPDSATDLVDPILHKLADAQLASGSKTISRSPSSSSKFHVVPDTFGPGSEPAAAAILPVDCQLEAVRYNTAKFVYNTAVVDSTSSRAILLGDTESSQRTVSTWEQGTSGPFGTYFISGYQMEEDPDLAVIIVDYPGQVENREFARASLAFARRHRIPAIALRLQEDWISDPALTMFIFDGIHLTVQDVSGSEDAIIRTLPIGVDMFLNLNPGQLSRHIRYLTERHAKSPKFRQSQPKSVEVGYVDVEKNALRDHKLSRAGKMRAGPRMKKMEPFICMLLYMLCAVMIFQGLAGIKTQYEIMSSRPGPAVPLVSVLRPAETPSQVSGAGYLRWPAKDTDVSTIPPPQDTTRPQLGSTWNFFEVEVVGSSHLVVKTTREHRNTNHFEVSVTRNGKPLHADVRTLFPFVWSVQLEAEQAYGDLCVRLSMERPKVHEDVMVNMGQQPLDAWFKTLLDDTEGKIVQKITQLQDSLEILQQDERPQKMVKHTRARLSQMVQQVKATLKSPEYLDRLGTFRQSIHDQTENVHRQASKLRAQLKTLSHNSASNRKAIARELATTVERMRARLTEMKLRNRANKLWEKVREGPQSGTLATAQDRAQHVVKELRARLRDR